MSSKRIGLKEVRELGPGKTEFDPSFPTFGIRRQKGDAVAYILKVRTAEGRQRWLTIGRHGAPWTPETARKEAQRLLGEVASGEDRGAVKTSKRRAATVAELCDLYLADAEAGRLLTRRRSSKKESTLVTDRGRVERHIKPLLGALKVASVTARDVDGFLHDVAAGKTAVRVKTDKLRGLANVRGGNGTATRTTGLLGSIFSYAVSKGMRPDNPVRGVLRFADGRRERRLNDEEYAKFGAALKQAKKTIWPYAISAARFMALTGWRLGEVLGLKWSNLDLARRTAILEDTKTGRSVRPLSILAVRTLGDLGQPHELVFQPMRGEGLMAGFPKFLGRIVEAAGLPDDITSHVLRHSFASVASDLGFSELTIGALIGHKGRTITSRYVHAADEFLLATSDRVAEHIEGLLQHGAPAVSVGDEKDR